MSGSLIDGGNLYVGSSYGNVTLRRCKSHKVNDGSSLEGFIPVGTDGAVVGSYRKPGPITIDLEIMPDVKPEVPWQALKASRELFTFTVQEVGGANEKGTRTQYQVQVSEFQPAGGDNGGEYMASVKLLVIGTPRILSAQARP